jgi:hypothetical protein
MYLRMLPSSLLSTPSTGCGAGTTRYSSALGLSLGLFLPLRRVIYCLQTAQVNFRTTFQALAVRQRCGKRLASCLLLSCLYIFPSLPVFHGTSHTRMFPRGHHMLPTPFLGRRYGSCMTSTGRRLPTLKVRPVFQKLYCQYHF